MIRKRIKVNGVVQGIGFRPHIYRTAVELELRGFVKNDSEGVIIEIEGPQNQVSEFLNRLRHTPPLVEITQFSAADISCEGGEGFSIQGSTRPSKGKTLISPDLAVCDDCLDELFDPKDRRYEYPFINCTNCGPRYTIINGLPYDREKTSMSSFRMCPKCLEEYNDPSNRRFHAQPNACHDCGPGLALSDGKNEIPPNNPVQSVIEALKDGRIAAIKGIGGFHLAVNPFNVEAIDELRSRKKRDEKPFALMATDIDVVEKYCHISREEKTLMLHYSRPIVLLKKRAGCPLPEQISPDNDRLGFMIAYSPLHHLLLKDQFGALIMTSANLSEEPIVKNNDEAMKRLGSIADIFLLHNRDILERCDDSVAGIFSGSPQLLRRARGYAPLPVNTGRKFARSVLAVGGQLKNGIALSRGDDLFLSQHIGDLDNPVAYGYFTDAIGHLKEIVETEPEIIAHDMHPEYMSTKWAMEQPLEKVAVQHHHAHMVSAMADAESTGAGVFDRTIGIILDGTGYGTDGTIWGGEVLVGDTFGFDRHGWLKQVPLPGGDKAARQAWRMAISYLYEAYGKAKAMEKLKKFNHFGHLEDAGNIIQMIEKDVNCPRTSSCGRLFDAVSAILGLAMESRYEAQAVIRLQNAAEKAEPNIKIEAEKPSENEIDTMPLIRKTVEMVESKQKNTDEIALFFHKELAELLIASALGAREKTGIDKVALSGGVFQNSLLFELMSERLNEEKFNVITHRRVPANDGGLAVGQAIIADAKLREGERG